MEDTLSATAVGESAFWSDGKHLQKPFVGDREYQLSEHCGPKSWTVH